MHETRKPDIETTQKQKSIVRPWDSPVHENSVGFLKPRFPAVKNKCTSRWIMTK